MLSRRALISVSDKTGLLALAQTLTAKHWQLLSTGGTAQYLRDHGFSVRSVADVTRFPEILDGRVKTLHPHIHGALLAKREDAVHRQQLKQFGIDSIDLLIVNLYPFVKTAENTNASFSEVIENIDIGGPAMIRAAAKNHQHLTVVVDPNDYPQLSQILHNDDFPSCAQRQKWAAIAFNHTAQYDQAITHYLQKHMVEKVEDSQPVQKIEETPLHDRLTPSWQCLHKMRYGENAHQQANLYVDTTQPAYGFSEAHIVQGKEMSYNNYHDADAALRCVMEFSQPACVIVKHANPCGVAVAADGVMAYRRAFQCDPTSAFGGIIAFNNPVEQNLAKALMEQFTEVILAPDYTPEALAIFSQKSNLRILRLPILSQAEENKKNLCEIRSITGGVLVQTYDQESVGNHMQVVSRRQPTPEEWQELIFAFTVAKHVKSNAIVFTDHQQTLGIGAGQMSRVDATRMALWKAKDRGLDLAHAVVASDAFFPFRDGIDVLAKSGVRAIIQPGGSIRDDEIIAAVNEYHLAMVFTAIRHFRH